MALYAFISIRRRWWARFQRTRRYRQEGTAYRQSWRMQREPSDVDTPRRDRSHIFPVNRLLMPLSFSSFLTAYPPNPIVRGIFVATYEAATPCSSCEAP